MDMSHGPWSPKDQESEQQPYHWSHTALAKATNHAIRDTFGCLIGIPSMDYCRVFKPRARTRRVAYANLTRLISDSVMYRDMSESKVRYLQ